MDSEKIGFDAGDWLRLKDNLTEQIRQAELTIILNKELLKFIEAQLIKCEIKQKILL